MGEGDADGRESIMNTNKIMGFGPIYHHHPLPDPVLAPAVFRGLWCEGPANCGVGGNARDRRRLVPTRRSERDARVRMARLAEGWRRRAVQATANLPISRSP